MNNWREIWGSEWEYVHRLGSAIHDPKEKRNFWETIKRKKEANPNFSIYELYPRSTNSKVRAMEECCQFVFSLRKLKDDVEKGE